MVIVENRLYEKTDIVHLTFNKIMMYVGKNENCHNIPQEEILVMLIHNKTFKRKTAILVQGGGQRCVRF